ncbi:MAG TPA: hypothetical protein ACFYEK_04280 [Candidatus Wunengus sp. YC60]|uniref:hypothetical protein n=1 Tax=Candidatus Wunengus sp. YC60 TaxID=3367697 RepID=UPI004025CC40
MKKLNLTELSKAFSVSQTTCRNWLNRGCPHERTSRGHLFVLADVIRWREESLKNVPVGSSEFEAARTEKEVYRAKMAKLNYERMDGTLVLAKEVTAAAFKCARLVRDSLLNIPGRLSAILAAEKDVHKINTMLDTEIRQALENLGKGEEACQS